MVVYGQTELTRDLYAARERAGGAVEFEVERVAIAGADTDGPAVLYEVGGEARRLDCDFVAGCDGFHGVSRQAIPPGARREYEKVYPFGWLGILSETPPVGPRAYLRELRTRLRSLLDAQRASEPLLHPMRALGRARRLDRRRLLERAAPPHPVRGGRAPGHPAPQSRSRSRPLRSFVCEPMRWGRLFLCGDAAHIVPPTGAKGLNTAASDVHYLYAALRQFYEEGDWEGIERYSERALARVWKAERFSWWLSSLLHRYPDQSPFDLKMQRAELDFLQESEAAQVAMAQNYVGLPY